MMRLSYIVTGLKWIPNNELINETIKWIVSYFCSPPLTSQANFANQRGYSDGVACKIKGLHLNFQDFWIPLLLTMYCVFKVHLVDLIWAYLMNNHLLSV